MDELVERLSQGRHPVELSLRPEKSLTVLSACLDRGYVHVRFTGTQGGTELGVRLDKAASQWQESDLATGAGTIRLVGHLSLNYVPVQCTAEIDLRDLTGEGYLQPV
jgi:hypothetical protein